LPLLARRRAVRLTAPPSPPLLASRVLPFSPSLLLLK
jgi:hypothetical protein